MFGESESESPRVPSPWDLVVTSASVDKLHYRQDELLLPKLSAEVEEVGTIWFVPMSFLICVFRVMSNTNSILSTRLPPALLASSPR